MNVRQEFPGSAAETYSLQAAERLKARYAYYKDRLLSCNRKGQAHGLVSKVMDQLGGRILFLGEIPMPLCNLENGMAFFHPSGQSQNTHEDSTNSHAYWKLIAALGYLRITTQRSQDYFIAQCRSSSHFFPKLKKIHVVSHPLSQYSQGVCIIDDFRGKVEEIDEHAHLVLVDLIRKGLGKEYELGDSKVKAHAKPSLTAIHKEIVRGVCRGLSNHEIADNCDLSVQRIKQNLETIFAEYNIDNAIVNKRPVLAAKASLASQKQFVIGSSQGSLNLCEKDKEILVYVVQGASNARIGLILNKSEYTIMNRVKGLYRALGIDDVVKSKRTKLAVKSVLSGIGPPASILGKIDFCRL